LEGFAEAVDNRVRPILVVDPTLEGFVATGRKEFLEVNRPLEFITGPRPIRGAGVCGFAWREVGGLDAVSGERYVEGLAAGGGSSRAGVLCCMRVRFSAALDMAYWVPTTVRPMRMAMITMTTSSSMRLNPREEGVGKRVFMAL
jgi:hypothetical protein